MSYNVRAAEVLRAMSPAHLDTVTELQTRGGDCSGWEAIVTGVRDALADAYDSDRFATEDESDVIHELADGLVPVYNSERMREALTIGAAWSHETELDTNGSDLIDIVGMVLYGVYQNALYNLANHVREAIDDDGCDCGDMTCEHPDHLDGGA